MAILVGGRLLTDKKIGGGRLDFDNVLKGGSPRFEHVFSRICFLRYLKYTTLLTINLVFVLHASF